MKTRSAFTMIELVFVIVVIGILAVVAVPKMAPIISDARTAKAKATLASVRSALATERQKLILRGETGGIVSLRAGSSGIFTNFVYKDKNNNDVNGSKVLEYDIKSCTHKGCWSTSDGVTYTYKSSNGDCTYKLVSNRFVDQENDGKKCELEE